METSQPDPEDDEPQGVPPKCEGCEHAAFLENVIQTHGASESMIEGGYDTYGKNPASDLEIARTRRIAAVTLLMTCQGLQKGICPLPIASIPQDPRAR
jgi:hypothetical protein